MDAAEKIVGAFVFCGGNFLWIWWHFYAFFAILTAMDSFQELEKRNPNISSYGLWSQRKRY